MLTRFAIGICTRTQFLPITPAAVWSTGSDTGFVRFFQFFRVDKTSERTHFRYRTTSLVSLFRRCNCVLGFAFVFNKTRGSIAMNIALTLLPVGLTTAGGILTGKDPDNTGADDAV